MRSVLLFRFALLALVSAPLCAAAPAQALLLKGGPSVLTNPSALAAESGEVVPNVHVGARAWLTDLFQIQGTVGYSDRFAAEGALLIRPFQGARSFEPYAFVGYGVLFGDERRRTVFPAGVGVEYDLRPNVGLFAEVAGRWQSERDAAARVNNLDFFLAPTVGVAYNLGGGRPAAYARADRADWSPAAPSPEGGEPVAEESSVSEEPAAESAPAAVADPAQAWGRRPAEVEDLGDRVRLPDGTFIMGLTDEDPLLLQTAGLKRVTITSFVIDKHEVSNADYRAYLDATGAGALPDAAAWERAGSVSTMESYFRSPAYGGHPVVAVTWQQAADYCAHAGGRLPTEAEWEYAARSGLAGGVYPWPGLEARGEDGAYLANFNPGRGIYAADGYAFTAPVDAFPATPWGIHNVAGNAAEWVQDAYAASYGALSNFNPMHNDPGEPRRIVRGGSWASDEFYIGVGVRDAQPATEASIYTGFRCAYGLDALPTEPAPEPSPEPSLDTIEE